MKSIYLILSAFLFLAATNAKAQCGTAPTSGTNTITTATTVLNRYYAGSGTPTAGTTSLTISTDASARGATGALATGDLVLIIQMQGADIHNINSAAYGSNGTTGSGYLNNANLAVGYYEYNVVQNYNATTGVLNLQYGLARNYYNRNFNSGASESIRRYQVIKVPRYFNLTINNGASVTALSWNGSTGGVVVLEAANTLTLNGSITVKGQGFRGGGGKNFSGVAAGNTVTATSFVFNSAVTTPANTTGGAKGEGIAGTPRYVNQGTTTTLQNTVEGYLGGSMGRGAPGNGGGGGTDAQTSDNGFNTGGGGGGNGGTGGQGGNSWSNNQPVGGRGGAVFTQTNVGRLVMGGGGGAATGNNSSNTTMNEAFLSGAAGGGIILVRAGSFAGSGSVNADGNAAANITVSGQTDGAGGGGAGGTIVMVTNKAGTPGLNSITASAVGGKGGNVESYFDHGPGGGGGGGMIITNGTFSSTVLSGGSNGFARAGTQTGPITNAYGATAGSAGKLISLTSPPGIGNAAVAGSPCGPLPVNLLSFAARPTDFGTTLLWAVGSGSTAAFFEAERSEDGRFFRNLGQVFAAENIPEYRFQDGSSSGPLSYYRLKITEHSGEVTYSQTLVVRNGTSASKSLNIKVQTNGIGKKLIVEGTEKDAAAQLSIFNTAGNLLYQATVHIQEGIQVVDLPTSDMPAGLYLLRLVSGSGIATEKMMFP